MARSAAASDSAGAVSAARKSAPVKWTWLFQKPAVTVPPEQSMILAPGGTRTAPRSEEHTSELQSHHDLVCRLLLEKKKKKKNIKEDKAKLANARIKNSNNVNKR